jgi:hypothetical protein
MLAPGGRLRIVAPEVAHLVNVVNSPGTPAAIVHGLTVSINIFESQVLAR